MRDGKMKFIVEPGQRMYRFRFLFLSKKLSRRDVPLFCQWLTICLLKRSNSN